MTIAHDKADELLALHDARLAESGQIARAFRDAMHHAIDEALAATTPTDPTVRGSGQVGKVTKTEKGTNGVYRITTDSPITDVRFDCALDLNTPFPDLRNFEVAGPVTWSIPPRPLIKATHDSLVQARLSYGTIHAQALPASGVATDPIDGIMGRRYLLDHCDIYGVDDGAGMTPGPDGRLDVELISTRIHHLLWRKVSVKPDGSHTDCLQIHLGGYGLRVIDSDLDGTALDARSDNGHPGQAMSLLMFSPWRNAKPLGDVLITRSRLRGGIAGLNMAGWTSAERFAVLANQIDCDRPILAKESALHPNLQVAGNVDSAGVSANSISRS